MRFLTRLSQYPQYLRKVAARPLHLSTSCSTRGLSVGANRDLESEYESRQSKYWTHEDVETMLRLHREGASLGTIAKTLDRSVSSVNSKRLIVLKFGPGISEAVEPVTRRQWTDEEFQKAQNLRTAGARAASIAAALGRSRGAVLAKFHRGDVEATATLQHGFWTSEEDKRLLGFVDQGVSAKSIAKLMGRSLDSIRGRTHYHRKHEKHNVAGTRVKEPWTREDHQKIQHLKQQGMSFRQMQAFFPGRSIGSIRVSSQNEPFTGETRSRHRAIWTTQEVETLRDLYAKNLSLDEIAVQMHRTIHAVKTKYMALFGFKKKYPRKWSVEEISKLKSLRSEGKTFCEIGILLNRNENSCKTKYWVV